MKIIGGNAAGNMIHKTGGIEHLQKINPQAGPAPEIPCPPAPCPPINPNAPLGAPVAVHEPAAGQRVDIEVVPNQPLIFDFNPLDLQATRADNAVTLTFPDGAQVVLHDIVGPCGPQPSPFQLPDGTIITPSELLHTFNLGDFGPCFPGLGEINPTAGPTPIYNTGFPYSPFDVGEIGPGLNGLGPLPPTGFGLTVEFLKGSGGSPPTPPGPPGPPTPPPPGTFLAVSEDVQNTVYPALPITGDYFTDTNYVTGQPVVSSSPAPFITAYHDPDTGSNTGVGLYGNLTLNTATGVYSYNLTPAGDALASQLGSDQLSANISHIPGTGYSLVDDYLVTTSNGFETGTSQFLLRTYGVDAPTSTANTVTETVGPGTAPELLLTYTDAADPSHSFQQLATISADGVVTFAAGSDTFVQPNDPALVTLEIVPGSGTASVTVTGVTIEGQTAAIGSTTLTDNGTQGLSMIVNPNLGATGTNQDPGDTGNASNALGSENTTAALATLSSTAVYTDPLSGLTETYGYLYDNTAGGAVVSMGGGATATADTLNFAGTPGTTSTTIAGSGAAGASNVIDWSSATNLTDGIPGLDINGGTGGGLNTLGIETAAAQNLDFHAGGTLTTGAGGNVQNIQVFDLSDGANPSAANSITLTPDAVFNLAGNEPGIIPAIGGGALAVWVLGTAADTVNLSGSSWTPISGVVVSGSPQVATQGPGAGNFGAAAGTSTQTQMVGFAEFAGTTTGGQTVHVYVENAIAQAAGHVHHT
ncbi:MAG TPA: hypothetical protein VFC38_00965 [Stellaceae bacterium]|nr:hypothetical protein [Stellaceae bacterium]